MTYSITFKECINYWNERRVFYHGPCIYGIVADAHYGIRPYIQFKDTLKFIKNYKTPTPVGKYTYLFFENLPTQSEFSRYYKDFLSYIKLKEIDKDF